MPNRDARDHFVVLDGMRGVAAIVVAGFHATQLFLGAAAAIETPALAVDFFFCLSGFVVAHAYAGRLAAGMSFGRFAMLRAIRLGPMILLGAALGGLVLLVGAFERDAIGLDTLAEILGPFLLIPVGLVFGVPAFPTNNPIWSLFFEIVANAVYARSRARRLRFLCGALAVSAGALVLVSLLCDGLSRVGFEGWDRFAFGFVRVAYPFLAGVLIHRLSPIGRSISIPASVAVLLLVAALTADLQPTWAFQAALSLVVYPLIVVIGANAQAHALQGAMIWLGTISYPLYLIHQPLLRVARNVPALTALAHDHPAAVVATSVAVCCGVATVTFHAFDVKARAWAAARAARSDGARRPHLGGAQRVAR